MLKGRSDQVAGQMSIKLQIHAPGILIYTVIALYATFLSDHYGEPQLLYALLIGQSIHFFSQQASNIVGVTVLSTLAMVAYPLFLNWMSAPPVQSGIFLGSTIHDVAQVVAAGHRDCRSWCQNQPG